MSWFHLDADSVMQRFRAAGSPPESPCMGTFLKRGIIGFTLLSVAGFAPWALSGRWFYRNVGEAGLYVVCALVFIGLSGPLLHRLILGPGALPRFYKLFGITFAVYSVLWIVGWMAFRGHTGSIVGLLAGTAGMGWLLALAFNAKGSTPQVIVGLFMLNALGYFIGGWLEGAVIVMKDLPLSRRAQVMLAKLLWGVCYGVGFGAGLGLAYYWCQARLRALVKSEPAARMVPSV